MSADKNIVLVTGGTGFIGRKVIDWCVQRGFRCRVFSDRLPDRNDASVEWILSDIRNAVAVESACRGARYVCHMAGALTEHPSDPDFLRSVNVDGTRNIVAASRRNRVERFVHISSTSAVEFDQYGVQDERAIRPRTRNWSPYARSKALAEEEVERLGEEMDWTIVYPTRVFGVGPRDASNAAAVVLGMHLKGLLPILPGGGTAWANWAFVDDVADGVVGAMISGRRGERYILGGENATLAEVFWIVRTLAGVRRIAVPVPHWVCRSIAAMEETRARILHHPPVISRQWYDAVFESTRLSCAKAEREIGYRITPLGAALKQVVDAQKNNGSMGAT